MEMRTQLEAMQLEMESLTPKPKEVMQLALELEMLQALEEMLQVPV